MKKLEEKEKQQKKEAEAKLTAAQKVQRGKETPAPDTSKYLSKEGQQMEQILLLFTGTIKPKVSSRVRFMILDLAELRKNKWVPRGGEKGPKTIEEVREQAEKERTENIAERIMVNLDLNS